MSHRNKFCQIPPTYSVWQFCNIFVQHCHYLGMSACRLRFVNSNARGNKNRQNVFLLSFTTTNKIFVSLSVLYVPSPIKIFSLFSCFVLLLHQKFRLYKSFSYISVMYIRLVHSYSIVIHSRNINTPEPFCGVNERSLAKYILLWINRANFCLPT